MNSIYISSARITNDLETKYTDGGTAIVNFSAADNHRNGDKEEAIFWRCAAYGKQAEFLAKYGMKGGRVNVIGEVQPNNYTNKDGQRVNAIQVRVTNIEIVDWKPAEQQTPQQGAMPQMGQPQGGMPQMGMQQMGNMGMQQMNGMGMMNQMGNMGMPQQNVNVQPAQFQSFSNDSMGLSGQENIGLIKDVPLEVTVELGRTTKSISEILEFSPGTIIELDRIAGEPIDVLVNGKFVAKGEVVVIEESFGVRITEIIK